MQVVTEDEWLRAIREAGINYYSYISDLWLNDYLTSTVESKMQTMCGNFIPSKIKWEPPIPVKYEHI